MRQTVNIGLPHLSEVVIIHVVDIVLNNSSIMKKELDKLVRDLDEEFAIWNSAYILLFVEIVHEAVVIKLHNAVLMSTYRSMLLHHF